MCPHPTLHDPQRKIMNYVLSPFTLGLVTALPTVRGGSLSPPRKLARPSDLLWPTECSGSDAVPGPRLASQSPACLCSFSASAIGPKSQRQPACWSRRPCCPSPSPPPPLCFHPGASDLVCARIPNSISSLHVSTSLSELPLDFPTGFLMEQTCYFLKFLFFLTELLHAVKYSFPVFLTIIGQASIRQKSEVDAVFPFCQPLLFFLNASLSILSTHVRVLSSSEQTKSGWFKQNRNSLKKNTSYFTEFWEGQGSVRLCSQKQFPTTRHRACPARTPLPWALGTWLVPPAHYSWTLDSASRTQSPLLFSFFFFITSSYSESGGRCVCWANPRPNAHFLAAKGGWARDCLALLSANVAGSAATHQDKKGRNSLNTKKGQTLPAQNHCLRQSVRCSPSEIMAFLKMTQERTGVHRKHQ